MGHLDFGNASISGCIQKATAISAADINRFDFQTPSARPQLDHLLSSMHSFASDDICHPIDGPTARQENQENRMFERHHRAT